MALNFDQTVRVGDILMVVLTLVILPAFKAFGAALFAMRDEVKRLREQMGQEDPPSGVIGDLTHLKREARRHRDWLIEANIIHPSDRT